MARLATPAAHASPAGMREAAETAVVRDWPNAQASRFVHAAGLRWHVQRMGAGPALLLIHGTGAATHSWRDLMPLLARDFDVIAPDLPGHGFTTALPPREMTLPGLASRLADLLDALSARPQLTVGHSAGAAVALRMALDDTPPLRAVIGLNAALMPFGGPLQQLFAPLARLLAASGIASRLLARRAHDRRAVLRVLDSTGSTIDERGIDCYQRLLTTPTHIEATLAMMARWQLAPLLGDLPALRSALRLLVGLGDRAVPPDQAARVVARLPATEVLQIPDAGHLMHEEQPHRFAALILETWRSLQEDEGAP